MLAALLLVVFLSAGCGGASPTAPSSRRSAQGPPITLAPASTPRPGPSIPPPDDGGTPQPDPSPDVCPVEVKRGISFYRADWPGGSCAGHPECSAVNRGGFQPGVLVSIDSTPLACDTNSCPLPLGCPSPATVWASPDVVPKTNPKHPFSAQVLLAAAGTYRITAHGPGPIDVTLTVNVR